MLLKRELLLNNCQKKFVLLEVLFSLELKLRMLSIMMTRVNTQVSMPKEDHPLQVIRSQTSPNSVTVQKQT